MAGDAMARAHGRERVVVPRPTHARVRVALLFLSAVALRVAVALRTAVIFDDGPIFISLAEQYSRGEWAAALSHPYHPLYPILILLGHGVGLDAEQAGLAVSILCGGISVVGVHALLNAAFDARVALIGSLLFLVSPYAVRFTSDVQSDGLYLACFVWGVYFLWRAFESGRWAPALATGALAGLGYLTRPEGLAIVLAAGLLATGRLALRHWSWPQWGRWLAALAAGIVVVAGPYLVALRGLGEAWRVSGKKSAFRLLGLSGTEGWVLVFLLLAIAVACVAGFRRQVREAPPDRGRWGGRLWGLGGAVLVVLALRWFQDLREFGEVLASTMRQEVAVLMGIGFIDQRRREPPARGFFFATLVVVHLVMLFGLLLNYEYLSRRHALPLVPLILGYASLGLLWLANAVGRLRGRGGREPEPIVLVMLVILLCGIASLKTLRPHRDDELAQRRAAEWLSAQSLPEGKVAAPKRRIAFYAEREWYPLMDEDGGLRSLPALGGEAVGYIVVDDDVLAGSASLDSTPGYRLRVLHEVEARGRHAIVYELTAEAPRGLGASPPQSIPR